MSIRQFLSHLTLCLLAFSLPLTGLAAGQKAESPKQTFLLKGVDVYGKPVNLDDYKGKAVLVSFFTVDCVKCENDLRLMREFYGENKGKNFVNIAINLDSDKQTLAEYMELIKIAIPAKQHFPIAWRKAKGHTDNFGELTSNPTHFVLGTDHKLLWRRNGIFKPDDWDQLWSTLP